MEKIAIGLTARQWEEVYYALETKAERIRNGDYGKVKDDPKWADELYAIGEEIQKHTPV